MDPEQETHLVGRHLSDRSESPLNHHGVKHSNGVANGYLPYRYANGGSHLHRSHDSDIDLESSAFLPAASGPKHQKSEAQNGVPPQISRRRLSSESQHSDVRLFGLSISMFPRRLQLAILACGVFSFHVGFGYLGEYVFKVLGLAPHSWLITLILFAVYALLGFVQRLLLNEGRRKVPIKWYCVLSIYTIMAMGFAMSSLRHLNYPTQIIFKCCKLIPVLLGGILVQGKRVTAVELVAALCMSVGLTFFILTDVDIAPSTDPRGYIYISMALVGDALLSNTQERKMKLYRATNAEIISYSYGIASVLVLFYMLITDQLIDSIVQFNMDPWPNYGYSVLHGVFGYLGTLVVLTLVKSFGAYVAVTVTTLRKAVTIVLSFVLFAKPFDFGYVWSGLVVLLGIVLNDIGKLGDLSDLAICAKLHKLARGASRLSVINSV